LNPLSGETLEMIELGENEAAFSITTCVFQSRGPEAFVVVGTAQNLRLHPRQHSGCFIHVYRLLENKLLLVNKTEVEDVPLAIIEFQGRLLAGVGCCLRIYDLGKKKLLKKSENRMFSSCICRIHTMGDRVFVGDMMESVYFVKYKRFDNSLVIFADDETPRMVASSTMLDYDTIAGSDKFGNIFVLRLPPDVSDDIDNPTGNRILWDTGYLNGAPDKIKQILHFYVGEVVTSMTKTSLIPGGAEVILYSTIMGRIGVLLPFTTREDVDFFRSLEMFMRQEMKPICGRDHLSYRSYFIPVREVIDGDLCEQILSLPHDKLKQISEDLDRAPSEILKKLEDTRNKLL
jgi:splicing factor 3B subunit 3